MSKAIINDVFLQRELDMLICILLMGLLPIDTINGVLLHNNISLPISVAQLYKSVLLVLLIIKVAFRPRLLFYAFIIFCVLISPSIYQVFKLGSISHLFPDFIKISRYLTIILSFYFFANYFQNNRGEKLIFQIVYISYAVVVINILVKYIGIGYPMYNYDDIGSRGFFFAGNEISVLLLILSAIIGKRLWEQKNYTLYFIIGFLSIFTALTISSKASMIGTIIIFLLVPIKRPSISSINFKAVFKYGLSILVVTPLIIMTSWRFIKNSKVYDRFEHFYEELDFLTFIYSNRNTFFFEYLEIYKEEYNLLEKFIGVGQTAYEDLSEMQTVEIDSIDILFAQGVLGLIVFICLIAFVLLQSIKFSFFSNYTYANFTFFMCVLLFTISNFSGHTFNSGMAGPFIGLTFALMYIKQNVNKT